MSEPIHETRGVSGMGALEVAIRDLVEVIHDNTRAIERLRKEMMQPLPAIVREGRPR